MKIKRVKRTPVTVCSVYGRQFVRIKLADEGKAAILDPEDAEAWTEAGLSWQWRLDAQGYVRVNVPGKGPMTVARCLMAAAKGERIEYVDGDPMNLQRCNLRAVRRGRRASDAAVAFQAFQDRQAQRRAEQAAEARA